MIISLVDFAILASLKSWLTERNRNYFDDVWFNLLSHIYIYMYMWALSRWSNANYHLKSIHPSNSTWFGHVSLRTWFSWQFVVGPKTKGGYESFTSSFVQDLGTRQYELRCWELIKSILRGIDSSQLRLLNTPGTPWILHEFYNFSYLFLMNLKFALKVLKQLRACPSLRLQKPCPWPRFRLVCIGPEPGITRTLWWIGRFHDRGWTTGCKQSQSLHTICPNQVL